MNSPARTWWWKFRAAVLPPPRVVLLYPAWHRLARGNDRTRRRVERRRAQGFTVDIVDCRGAPSP